MRGLLELSSLSLSLSQPLCCLPSLGSLLGSVVCTWHNFLISLTSTSACSPWPWFCFYSCTLYTQSHFFYVHAIIQSPEPDSDPLSPNACWRLLSGYLCITTKFTCPEHEGNIFPQNFVPCFNLCGSAIDISLLNQAWKLTHLLSILSYSFKFRWLLHWFSSSPCPWPKPVSHQTHLTSSLFLLSSTLLHTTML